MLNEYDDGGPEEIINSLLDLYVDAGDTIERALQRIHALATRVAHQRIIVGGMSNERASVQGS